MLLGTVSNNDRVKISASPRGTSLLCMKIWKYLNLFLAFKFLVYSHTFT